MSAALLKKSIQIVEESQNDQKKTKNYFSNKNNMKGKDLSRFHDVKLDDNKRSDKMKKSIVEKKHGALDKSTAEMLFDYARGENRNYLAEDKKKKKKKEEVSIFTEEDFKKFEQEYFN